MILSLGRLTEGGIKLVEGINRKDPNETLSFEERLIEVENSSCHRKVSQAASYTRQSEKIWATWYNLS